MHKKSLEAAAHLENEEIDKGSNEEDDKSVDACSPAFSNNNGNNSDNSNNNLNNNINHNQQDAKLSVYHQYDRLQYLNNNINAGR